LLVFHFITLTATNDNLRGNKILKKKKLEEKNKNFFFPKTFFPVEFSPNLQTSVLSLME